MFPTNYLSSNAGTTDVGGFPMFPCLIIYPRTQVRLTWVVSISLLSPKAGTTDVGGFPMFPYYLSPNAGTTDVGGFPMFP